MITSSIGIFDVKQGDNNNTLLMVEDKVVTSICDTYWWDADKILSFIKDNADLIKEKIAELKVNPFAKQDNNLVVLD
jgi:hypothetical protein